MNTLQEQDRPPIRVAVVGGGHWGRNLVRSFAGLGALAAIVEPDAARAGALAAEHGSEVLTFEQVLDDPAIGAVAIATPAATHAALAGRALRAGKDVFVEKPLALDVGEARTLVRLAAGIGRRLMVGHLLQYHPAFVALKAFVQSGALGRISYVHSNRLSLGKVRREEDVLWSFAPHDISMMIALLGEAPDRVQAFTAPILHPEIGDACQVQLAFPSGIRAHVFASWLHPFKEQRLVVTGDRGMAVFEDSAAEPGRRLLHYPHRIDWAGGVPTPVRGEAVPLPYEAGEPLRLECAHFLACCADRRTPLTDGEEGLRVLQVLAAATASLDDYKPRGAPTTLLEDRYPDVSIHESAIIADNARIGAGTRIWHFCHVLGHVTIGRNCSLGQNVVVGPRVTIGDGVRIQNNVSVFEGVTLEDHVFCGPSCVFTNVLNPRAEVPRKAEYRPTLVRKGATIGANATIVCGNTLGTYAFVAAGAVVTKDVPDFALVAGVPARRIGWMSHVGLRLGPDLVCAETGRRYRETGPDRLEEIT